MMTHFLVAVILPNSEAAMSKVQFSVDDLLARYSENDPAVPQELQMWDWYVIGGRYSGKFTGGEGVARVGAPEVLGDENVVPVQQMLDSTEESFCYAMVTPDGEWHARGKLGWFAVSLTEEEDRDEWNVRSRQLLKPFTEGHRAVCVDCHI